ncbi:MAG: threonine synthase, partial [Rhodobacteraceae bacterium]|nr:threonine synthase [Paracoccaceae bacterium]
AKFPDALEKANGLRAALPGRMAELYQKPERVTKVDNNLEILKNLIQDRINS